MHAPSPQTTLAEIRGKVEKHIKNTWLKRMQAPVGVKPVLKAWMELTNVEAASRRSVRIRTIRKAARRRFYDP